MEKEIKRCVELLLKGKVFLYPTDTVWGLGCDATNEEAIHRIYEIKRRQESKNMLILLDDASKLSRYVHHVPTIVWALLKNVERPTTYIYPHAKNLPTSMIADDGSIAIRIVQDGFCQKLLRELDRPLVSTSANISGMPSPATFNDMSTEVLSQVDYVVPTIFENSFQTKPSRIIRLIDDDRMEVLRD